MPDKPSAAVRVAGNMVKQSGWEQLSDGIVGHRHSVVASRSDRLRGIGTGSIGEAAGQIRRTESGRVRERGPDEGKQVFRLQRLAEAATDPRMKRALSGRLIGVRGHDDRRHRCAGIEQVLVQLKPCHARHPQVGDEACGQWTKTGLQECRGACEFRRPKAKRAHEGGNGLARRLIIVHDRHEWMEFQCSSPIALAPPRLPRAKCAATQGDAADDNLGRVVGWQQLYEGMAP